MAERIQKDDENENENATVKNYFERMRCLEADDDNDTHAHQWKRHEKQELDERKEREEQRKEDEQMQLLRKKE